MPVVLSRTIRENPSLSQTDINYGYEFRSYDNGEESLKYIISDSVNRNIRANDIAVTARDEPYRIPKDYEEYSRIMLEHQLGAAAAPGQFENHRICGLYSDLMPDSEEATIGMVEYYDLLATFYSFPYIYRDEADNIVFHGSNYIYNAFGVVYPLSLMLGANPIGANTIAVTSDNKLLVCKQADDAHINPGKLMPSGSGSASWHDYIDIEAKTLQEIVRHGAEYKMRIECKIPDGCGCDTEVLGMARVPIGMKPDFYCFTKLDATLDELKASGAEPYAVVEADDSTHLSDALLAYIEGENAREPGSVSIQLYLEAVMLAEICR